MSTLGQINCGQADGSWKIHTHTQVPAEVRPAGVWLVGNNMGVITYSFNLNMPYGVLECDIVMLQNYVLMIL